MLAWRVHLICTVLFLALLLWGSLSGAPATDFVAPSHLPPQPLCPWATTPDSEKTFFGYMEEYAELHQRILEMQPPEKRKFLIFKASSHGLGNRIAGLMFAFVGAVLTNRALIVDWKPDIKSWSHIDDILQPPSKNMNWTGPRAERAVQETISALGWTSLPPPRWIPFWPGTWTNWDSWFENLMCAGDGGFASSEPILHISAAQYHAQLLAHNPSFRSKMCELFGDNSYQSVIRWLIRPRDHIQARIDAVLRQDFDTAHRVVALQLRRKDAFSVTDDQEKMFVWCGAQLAEDMKKRPPRLPRRRQSAVPEAPPRVRYFLATDDIRARERMQKIFGDDLISIKSPTVSKETVAGIEDALVDMILLSEADEIIVSPWSTFGHVAYGRGGMRPHFITEHSHCFRAPTNVPVYTYWPGMSWVSCWSPDSMLTTGTINQWGSF